MKTRMSPSRLIASVAVVLVLTACRSAPTGPDQSAMLRAGQTVSATNLPPASPCASGWILVDGRWVCSSPGN